VVFDVDDTLYLERDYVASGFAAVERTAVATLGAHGFAAVAWQAFLDGDRGNIFDRALTSLGITYQDDDVKDLVRCYRTHAPQIALLPDARAALDKLHASGTGLAFLTDGPVESQANKVKALGLGEYTDVIVLTAALGQGYGKPHRRGFEHITSVTGADMLTYVADNPNKDFAAPRALGWTTIRVRRAGGLHASCPDSADIDETIGDLADVVEVMQRAVVPDKGYRHGRSIR
jgi:putative hydrolase of the HAD superfamily